MRWTEEQYYLSSPEGFFYACEGYFDERQELEEWIRTIGYNIHLVMGGKNFGKKKYWPMTKDGIPSKNTGIVKVWGDTDPELIRKAMQIHNVNPADIN